MVGIRNLASMFCVWLQLGRDLRTNPVCITLVKYDQDLFCDDYVPGLASNPGHPTRLFPVFFFFFFLGGGGAVSPGDDFWWRGGG